MKNKMHRLETLSFYDHTGIEKHLAKMAQRGWMIDTPSTAVFQKVILAVLAVLVLSWIINLTFGKSPLLAVIAILVFMVIFLTRALVDAVKQFLKRKKLSAGLNRVLTVLASFVTAFALMGIAIQTGISLSEIPAFSDAFKIGEPPLKIEDLMDTSYQGYVTSLSPDASLPLSRLGVEQRQHFDDEPSADIPHMEYDLYQVNIPGLYHFFESKMKRTVLLGYGNNAQLIELDNDLFGAVKAYCLTGAGGEPLNRYVLCYNNMLVDIEFNWSLTEDQMSTVGEKLDGSLPY